MTVHLDRSYDRAPARALLAKLGFEAAIACKGVPAPVPAGARWVVERTHAWMNGCGKLRRCTEKCWAVVDFYLLAALQRHLCAPGLGPNLRRSPNPLRDRPTQMHTS